MSGRKKEKTARVYETSYNATIISLLCKYVVFVLLRLTGACFQNLFVVLQCFVGWAMVECTGK